MDHTCRLRPRIDEAGAWPLIWHDIKNFKIGLEQSDPVPDELPAKVPKDRLLIHQTLVE
jgi:hypothetical protein